MKLDKIKNSTLSFDTNIKSIQKLKTSENPKEKIGKTKFLGNQTTSFDKQGNYKTFQYEIPKAVQEPQGLYTKSKNDNDTYNEAFRYLKYKIKPERFKQTKSFHDWKNNIEKNYYLSKTPINKNSKSLLVFRSKKDKDVVIPFKTEISKIIENAHNPFSTIKIKHNGIHTVLHNIQADNIYWAKMKQDITNYIATCSDCIILKPEKVIKQSKTIETVGPLHRYIADLYQIPKNQSDAASKNSYPNYKYVLMVVDHFSKYLWGTLLENKEGSTIIQEMELIFKQFGKPKIFHSDNGREFQNKMTKQFCEDENIIIKHGNPYHPQSQGAI